MTTVTEQRSSRRRVVREWLTANPGWHRPTDVAAATDLPKHAVATDLIHLSDAGHVLRRRRVIPGRKSVQSVYASPATAVTE